MKNFLNKLHIPIWLFFILIFVLILRVPSFFEPYSYGDETIYLTLGEAVRQGVPLYSGVHDNKPPLLYLIAAAAGNLFWFKAILAVWNLVTIFLFWKLASELFPKNKKLEKVSTFIFAIMTTIPLLEGNIANAEIFMIAFTIWAFLIIFKKDPNFKNIFVSGILFSMAALFKIPAAFELPTIIFLWIIALKSLRFRDIIRISQKALYLILGFITPIAISFIWYYFQGALSEYITAAYLQNVGYLSSFRPGDVVKPFFVRNAPLLIRFAVLSAGLIILYWKRNKLSHQFIFITTWLLFTLFAVTLSERPYPHYLIQSVAPVSLLLGILFSRKNIEQVYVILPLTLTFFVPFYYHFWHYKTLPYYERFIKLSTGNISKEDYLSSFGGEVVRNYAISKTIVSLTKPQDRVFVWGDSSSIYALSRRLPPGKYVAGYHIKDFSSDEETLSILTASMPSLIIMLPEASFMSGLQTFLNKNYGLIDTINNAQIWKSLGPKLRGLESF